jgi:hypothetical protein
MVQAFALARRRDRRAADRLTTALRGKVFPGAADCVIADFSKRGARLRFDEAPPADACFVLVVWSSGLAFQAEVRWSEGDELGVEFMSSRDLRRPAPPHLAEIQSLWLKRRPRMQRRTLLKKAPIIRERAHAERSGWRE